MTPEELRILSYRVALHEGLTVNDRPELYSGPKFAEDWSAGGHLIAKYELCVRPSQVLGLWIAYPYFKNLRRHTPSGTTPLIAVCRVVVSMEPKFLGEKP